MFVIYQAELNGGFYIGLSKNFNARKKEHQKCVSNGKKSDFYDAAREYGWDNIKWDIICELDNYETLKAIEYDIIKEYQDLGFVVYNMAIGGGLPPTTKKGIVHSMEHRAKISATLKAKGTKPPVPWGNTYGKANKGRKNTTHKPLQHGTLRGYGDFKCRCDLCRKAKSDQYKRLK